MAHKKTEVFESGYIGFVGEKDDARACFFSHDREAMKARLEEYMRNQELEASDLSIYDLCDEAFILRGQVAGFTWERI